MHDMSGTSRNSGDTPSTSLSTTTDMPATPPTPASARSRPMHGGEATACPRATSIAPTQPLSLGIRTLMGEEFMLTVASNATLDTLRQHILRVKGIPVEQQVLVHRGQQLTGSDGGRGSRGCNSLQSLGICSGATLTLLVAMGGGQSLVAASSASLGAYVSTGDAAHSEPYTYSRNRLNEDDDNYCFYSSDDGGTATADSVVESDSSLVWCLCKCRTDIYLLNLHMKPHIQHYRHSLTPAKSTSRDDDFMGRFMFQGVMEVPELTVDAILFELDRGGRIRLGDIERLEVDALMSPASSSQSSPVMARRNVRGLGLTHTERAPSTTSSRISSAVSTVSAASTARMSRPISAFSGISTISDCSTDPCTVIDEMIWNLNVATDDVSQHRSIFGTHFAAEEDKEPLSEVPRRPSTSTDSYTNVEARMEHDPRPHSALAMAITSAFEPFNTPPLVPRSKPVINGGVVSVLTSQSLTRHVQSEDTLPPIRRKGKSTKHATTAVIPAYSPANGTRTPKLIRSQILPAIGAARHVTAPPPSPIPAPTVVITTLPTLQPPQPLSTPAPPTPSTRCYKCCKKLTIVSSVFRCRCGDVFCLQHRYSDRHECTFDYKGAAKFVLMQQNPTVVRAKI